MNQELTNQLKTKYPSQFKNLLYIQCGDGWYQLLSSLCEVIQRQLDIKIKNDFYWIQIKEKFGGLRAYCRGADDYIRGGVSVAEHMSYSICEYSGEKGKLRKQKIGENGQPVFAWMKTLSDKEAEKEGYV